MVRVLAQREVTMRARVVIADGERGIAVHLGQELKEAGYEVVAIATTGPQALDFCLEYRPDFMLMDIESPDLDGLAMTTRILAACPTCVIAISTRPDLAPAAERAGAMGHVVVPATGKELTTALGSARRHCGRRSTPAAPDAGRCPA
jgi:two-component system, response regulator PdtaR